MKTILIDGKEYRIEFYFEAAMNQDFVSKCYKMVSGGYIMEDRLSGVANSVAALPELCLTAFQAGLLENDNTVDREKAKSLMLTYMKDHKLSFVTLWEELKDLMEQDGFFDLTGITEMLEKTIAEIQRMTEEMEQTVVPAPKKSKKASSTTVK